MDVDLPTGGELWVLVADGGTLRLQNCLGPNLPSNNIIEGEKRYRATNNLFSNSLDVILMLMPLI